MWEEEKPANISRRWLVATALTLAVSIGIVYLYKNISEQNAHEQTAQQKADRELATKQQRIATLITSADKTAAMYDYTEAINILKTYNDWESEAELTAKITEYEAADAQLIDFTAMETTTHVFFHSLIVDSDRAFTSDSSAGYNQFMTTVSEFKKMLENFYEKDFVLVSMHDIAKLNPDGTFTKGKIRIPKGKKPMVISQDDVNYYYYMIGTGFADKIILDEDGKPTVQYTDAAGNTSFGEYDLVAILDNFIDEHPDFSYHGNKALLCLTGYNGVLGWRTQPDAKDVNREAEITNAQIVAAALKAEGYEFASHGWGHLPIRTSSTTSILSDNKKWDTEVRPIIGETDIYIRLPARSRPHRGRHLFR